MQVAKKVKFDEYWEALEFRKKRPLLSGSKKQAFGDNVYHRDKASGQWVQEPSHHSHSDNSPNANNVSTDTSADAVLIGQLYVYWGGSGPTVPQEFIEGGLCAGRGHRSVWATDFTQKVIDWLQASGQGYMAEPERFK